MISIHVLIVSRSFSNLLFFYYDKYVRHPSFGCVTDILLYFQSVLILYTVLLQYYYTLYFIFIYYACYCYFYLSN